MYGITSEHEVQPRRPVEQICTTLCSWFYKGKEQLQKWSRREIFESCQQSSFKESYNEITHCTSKKGCPRGIMVKAMHCGIVVREFVLQSRYYVHFRANTLGKGMNPLILPPAMGK